MKKATQALPNQELIDARLRQGWSQQELADRIGTTSVNISRWERGATSPSPYFRQQLCALFKTPAQELGFLPKEKPVPPELNGQVVYLPSHVELEQHREDGGRGHYSSPVETESAQS